MFKLTAAAVLGLLAVPAYGQAPANPTQQRVSDNQTAIFHVTVVGRTISAINYRPRSGSTKVEFAGTTLLPDGRGYAEVSGEKGYMKIDAHFDNLQPAMKFGPEYLTYVLWAITPEGRAKNLGEVQVDDKDARIQVTTEMQAFGMIVTAEPYFAVTQPSDVVVFENVVTEKTKGNIEAIEAKYELLKRGTYLMNQDAGKLKVKPLEPGAPLDLAEARNAVELAKLARADHYAADTFVKASRLLGEAELAREKHKKGNEVQQPARQAAQTAEDARLIAIQRQEEEFQAAQRAAAAERERVAQQQALAAQQAAIEAQRRTQQEQERVRAEQERRRQAELDAQTAAASRDQAEKLRLEAERQQQAALQARTDADAARAAAEAERQRAEDARRLAEQQAQQAQAAAAQSEQDKDRLRQQLREQLNVILETRETARGLIVNLSDVLFDTASANLKPGAREKLARVAGILASHPDLHIEIDGHTDSVGDEDYNQRLSERRAESVRAYLVEQKVSPSAVGTAGFGETRPVATNGTAAGRQQNRRVEIVVTGESIGR